MDKTDYSKILLTKRCWWLEVGSETEQNSSDLETPKLKKNDKVKVGKNSQKQASESSICKGFLEKGTQIAPQMDLQQSGHKRRNEKFFKAADPTKHYQQVRWCFDRK